MNGVGASQFDPEDQHHSLEGVLRATRITLLTCWIGGLFAPFAVSGAFLYFQDGPLLLLQLILGGLALTPWGDRFIPQGLRLSFKAVAFIALALLMFCYAGHYWILDGYDLSRDEQMAGFDMRIYAAHRLAWPLPTVWRGDAAALNLQFMLPVQHPVAWVSAYLPGNAMIRTLVGTIADPALTGPIYTALSVLLLWGCARRIWPQDKAWDHEAATVALLLLVLSGQVLFTGMTAFAMPAHLFVNLLWLWLFLADRRRTDLVALAVGFVGTGLHQPLFHPLFVLPFLVLLLSKHYWGRRRWGRLALFVGVYALIGAFWMWWPHYIHGLVAGPGSVTDPGIGFIERLQSVVKQNDHPLPVMASNLLPLLHMAEHCPVAAADRRPVGRAARSDGHGAGRRFSGADCSDGRAAALSGPWLRLSLSAWRDRQCGLAGRVWLALAGALACAGQSHVHARHTAVCPGAAAGAGLDSAQVLHAVCPGQ